MHSLVQALPEGLSHGLQPWLPQLAVLLGYCPGLVHNPRNSHSISVSCLYCCWIWGSVAAGLGPLGSVKILLNGSQDQGHSPCLVSAVVTPLHPGQAHRHWEPLKARPDTAPTSQGLGNSASGSGRPEAVGAGLALAGAQEAEEFHH